MTLYLFKLFTVAYNGTTVCYIIHCASKQL